MSIFQAKKDIKRKFFNQVTIFVFKINSFGRNAEEKKVKRLKFLTIFELLKFVLNDKVSTIAIQQFTL